MNTSVAQRRPLGQILISEGILSEDQLRIALLEQMKQNQPIGKLLVSLGFVTEATLRQALSESLGKQSIDLGHAVVDPQALKRVPRDLAMRYHLLPLDYDEPNRRLTLAISDDLCRTIEGLPGVLEAHVHLFKPAADSLTGIGRPGSASVVAVVNQGCEIKGGALAEIVAGATGIEID